MLGKHCKITISKPQVDSNAICFGSIVQSYLCNKEETVIMIDFATFVLTHQTSIAD